MGKEDYEKSLKEREKLRERRLMEKIFESDDGSEKDSIHKIDIEGNWFKANINESMKMQVTI